jgi:hypothetical protein
MRAGKRELTLAAVFVAGLLIGWFVLGWLLFPVHWANVNPWEMRPSARATYLDLVAEDYAIHHDRGRLNALLMGWPRDDLAESLPKLITYYQQRGQTARARAVSEMMDALGSEVAAPIHRKGSPIWKWLWILIKVVLLTLLFVGVLYAIWYLKKRLTGSPKTTVSPPATVEREERTPPEAPPTTPQPTEPKPTPVTAVAPGTGWELVERATLEFHIGEEPDYADSRDLLKRDESRSETEFLGSYGLGPEEWLDEKHDLPCAFAVWLFDKLDQHTRSVFLLSPGVWRDAGLREKLLGKPDAASSEMVKIAPGASFRLETRTMYLQGVVSSVSYSPKADGEAAVSEIRIEVGVYRNPEAEVPSFLRKRK